MNGNLLFVRCGCVCVAAKKLHTRRVVYDVCSELLINYSLCDMDRFDAERSSTYTFGHYMLCPRF